MDNAQRHIFWLDRFSLLPLLTVLRLSAGVPSEIRYHSTGRIFGGVWLLLQGLTRGRVRAVPVAYSLGDMKSADGSALRYEVETRAAALADMVSNAITESALYRGLREMFPSKRLVLYYRKRIKYDAYALVRTACVAGFCKRSGDGRAHTIVWPGNALFKAVRAVWDDEIPLELTAPVLLDYNRLKTKIKRLIIFFEFLLGRVASGPWIMRTEPPQSEPKIAVHYFEGIDLSRRNDVFWVEGSGIPPEQLLLYCDGESFGLSPITAETISDMDRRGFKWVFLRRNPRMRRTPVWAPLISTSGHMRRLKRLLAASARREVDDWLLEASGDLIYNVLYWKSFYFAFNVRIDVDIEEMGDVNAAKAIAMDVMGGFLVGYQRSELLEIEGVCYGMHPQHVFFTWHERAARDIRDNGNMNEAYVVSGYCYDYAFELFREQCSRTKEQLRSRGAEFIIALYDNIFGSHSHFSKSMVEEFYRPFLEWLLSDPTVGLVLKPKKTWFLEKNLPRIKAMLEEAQATGRCIVHGQSQGHFPSNISMAADFAVGIGISSALMEAVLSGTRGVLCDVTLNQSHYFFKHGYGRVLFHDVEDMMGLIKRHKAGDSEVSYLGDFSPWLESIDPFRDGKAHQRIGGYVGGLMAELGRGLDRDAALRSANARYEALWGSGRIFTSERERRHEQRAAN